MQISMKSERRKEKQRLKAEQADMVVFRHRLSPEELAHHQMVFFARLIELGAKTC